MTTTLKDIAQYTGLSVSTVSNILTTDDERYSDATRELVHKAAEELDYHPHHGARSMLIGASNVIGVLVPDLSFSFFPDILYGIEQEAYAAGYQVLVCQTHYDAETEAQRLSLLRQHRVDGLILCPIPFSATNKEIFSRIKKSATPAVCVDSEIDGVAFDFVGTDDYAGARTAVEHLISLGHTRIACICFGDNSTLKQNRLKGYCDALSDNSIEFDNSLLITAPWRLDEPGDALVQCMQSDSPPTAIFAMSDIFAVWAYFSLKENDLHVPDDVALIGFGGLQEGRWLDTPLTTVVQPREDIGRNAVTLLMKRIRSARKPTERILLQPELLIRASCGARKDSPLHMALHVSPVHPHSPSPNPLT